MTAYASPSGPNFNILEVSEEQIELRKGEIIIESRSFPATYSIQDPSTVNAHRKWNVGKNPFVKVRIIMTHTWNEPGRRTTEVDNMSRLLLDKVRDELRAMTSCQIQHHSG